MSECSSPHVARIGLGSNAHNASDYVMRGFAALKTVGRVIARSSLYRTKAWGVTEQPDFINAAALLETGLSPRALLRALKALEAALGRRPTFRWGPRAIDFDILAYDDLTLVEPGLVIPHERLHERAFALVPLAEIDPAFAPSLLALPLVERAAVQRIPVATARNQRIVNWDQTLERVRAAAQFCASAELARFRIEEEDLAIDVRRTARPPLAVASVAPTEGVASANGSQPSSNGNPALEGRPRSVLKAEFVGVVRFSRPTVARGAVLTEDRELAYVESLGIRNPIRSGGPGIVATIFVTDGAPVEYGQPLFAIEK